MGKKYYAGHCEKGNQVAFSHWWNAFGFNSKEERDNFVQANRAKRKAITRKQMEKIAGRLGCCERYGILLNKSLIYCENFPDNLVEKFEVTATGYVQLETNYVIESRYVDII